MSDIAGIIWLVILLVFNAFFVGAEFAVISARRSQIEPRAAAGSRAAATTLWAMERATLMLATSQLCITVCSLVILNVSEPAIHHLLEYPLSWTGLTPSMVTTVAFVIALVLVTFLHVVFGEMVPKNISVTFPEKAALRLIPPLLMFAKVFYPIIAVLNLISNFVLRLFGIEPKNEVASAFTADEVASIVAASAAAGVLQDDQGLISGALEFSDHNARDVMVPVADVAGVSIDVTPAQIELNVAATGYSRFLVRDTDGQVRGYVHLKILPGADDAIIEASVRLADRVSVNLEAPNAARLAALSCSKDFGNDLLVPLRRADR